MVEWRITQYHADENGEIFGEPYQSICYTLELMQSYQDPKFVVKIEQFSGGRWKTVWTPDMPPKFDALNRKYKDITNIRW